MLIDLRTEVLPDSIEQLKNKLAKAKGESIALKKRTPNGEDLELTVITKNFPPDQEDLEAYLKTGLFPPFSGLNFAYVSAKNNEQKIVPVGRYEMTIIENNGCGSGCIPDAVFEQLIETESDQLKQLLRWGRGKLNSFFVDESYQRFGIGSILATAALASLDNFGIKNFRPTILRTPSYNLWKKFGVKDEYYESKNAVLVTAPTNCYLNIYELLKSDHAINTAKKFIADPVLSLS